MLKYVVACSNTKRGDTHRYLADNTRKLPGTRVSDPAHGIWRTDTIIICPLCGAKVLKFRMADEKDIYLSDGVMHPPVHSITQEEW